MTLSNNLAVNWCVFSAILRPVKDLIEDIKSGSGNSFGFGKLQELCKMLPDDGEVIFLLYIDTLKNKNKNAQIVFIYGFRLRNS